MLLGGLWHGANWTFVLWGAFHGLMLAFERARGKRTVYAIAPRPVRVALTFVLVLFSWVLFRATTLDEAIRYIAAMSGAGGNLAGSSLLAAELYSPGRLIEMGLCAILAFTRFQAFDWVERLTPPKVLALIALFAISLMTMFTQAFNPFLYFQF
jgi:alginate O-acetyltransferase complex protein AlgI